MMTVRELKDDGKKMLDHILGNKWEFDYTIVPSDYPLNLDVDSKISILYHYRTKDGVQHSNIVLKYCYNAKTDDYILDIQGLSI